MKNLFYKISTLIILILVSAIFTPYAGANLAGIQEEQYQSQTSVEISTASSQPLKARAPEPSTIALFFSGCLGMIISFVRQTYLITKRVIDIALSALAMIILAPIALLIIILIKLLSPGPAIFTQIRVGRNEQPFKMYKFRTMKLNAEQETGPVWAQKNDPRLIPMLGQLLRKTHMDEIPQFFNVLKGDMSIVGPRPERPIFVEKLSHEIQDYKHRLNVKPGITGLAQVRHHYDETIWDVRKKVKYDLLYIRNVCLWTDLRILLRTLRVVLTGQGAR